MADQVTYSRACRIEPATGSPIRARDVYLEDFDHAAVSGDVWTACGVAAFDVMMPLPFLAELPGFLRPPRCPACLAAVASG